MCVCSQEEGHEGPHLCKCGGCWSFTKDGKFRVHAWPPGVGVDPMVLALSAMLPLHIYDPDE